MLKRIKQSWLMAIINKWKDEKHHEIKIRDSFDTACWSFAKGHHSIFIGDNIFHNSTKEDDDYLLASYLYHELSHGMWTNRDLKGLFEQAKSKGIPIGLLNLAEDARIEHLFRLLSKRTFKWSSLCDDENILSPCGILFSIIQNEGELPNYDNNLIALANKVYEFYLNFIECKETNDLFPLLLDWVNLFEEDNHSNEQNQELLEQIQNAEQSDYDKHIDIIGNLDDVNDADSHSIAVLSDCANDKTEEENKINSFDVSSDAFLSIPADLDVGSIDRLFPQVESILTKKGGYISSALPSKRLNIKGVIRGEKYRVFRRKELNIKSKVNINLIVDCSGSMEGLPMNYARTIIAVFNMLAHKNLVAGSIILTSSRFDCLKINLPVNENDIGYIADTKGAEGLFDTFESNIDILKGVDMNFIITDGHICDGSLDKRKYQRLGIKSFGLYVGNGCDDGDLLRWFDKGVSRTSVELLIAVMVRELKYYF